MRTTLGVAAALLARQSFPPRKRRRLPFSDRRVFRRRLGARGLGRPHPRRPNRRRGTGGRFAAPARSHRPAGATLTPGLVEGHSHILLHAYTRCRGGSGLPRGPRASRGARNQPPSPDTDGRLHDHPRFGTEGAGYADVELKQAVDQGIIPGPRMLASTRAIVATGSYPPKFAPEWHVPQGAEEADGVDALIRVVRDQMGRARTGSSCTRTIAGGTSPGARPTFSATR